MALIGGTGAATASPDHDRSHGDNSKNGQQGLSDNAGVMVQNGRFEMNISRSEWNSINPKDIKGIPDDTIPVPYEIVKNAVEDFNEAIAAGDLGFEERNGQHVVVPQNDIPEINGGNE
jgi:hypothetical protein